MDMLFNPSVTETFGNVTLEAMASGLPVVAARATGSSNRVTRALVITEPLSLDAGEVTDKGTVVQAKVRQTRSELVDRLYANDPDVLRIHRQ